MQYDKVYRRFQNAILISDQAGVWITRRSPKNAANFEVFQETSTAAITSRWIFRSLYLLRWTIIKHEHLLLLSETLSIRVSVCISKDDGYDFICTCAVVPDLFLKGDPLCEEVQT